MRISIEKVDGALRQVKLLPQLKPPPNSLPLYRRMRFWRDPDDPVREVGLMVIDGFVLRDHWNRLRQVFEERGECLPDLND